MQAQKPQSRVFFESARQRNVGCEIAVQKRKEK